MQMSPNISGCASKMLCCATLLFYSCFGKFLKIRVMIILTKFLKMLIFVYFRAFALFLHLRNVSNRN